MVVSRVDYDDYAYYSLMVMTMMIMAVLINDVCYVVLVCVW